MREPGTLHVFIHVPESAAQIQNSVTGISVCIVVKAYDIKHDLIALQCIRPVGPVNALTVIAMSTETVFIMLYDVEISAAHLLPPCRFLMI